MRLSKLVAAMLAIGAFSLGACGGGGSDSSSSSNSNSNVYSTLNCDSGSCGDLDIGSGSTLPKKYQEGFTFDVLSSNDKILLGTTEEIASVDELNLEYGQVVKGETVVYSVQNVDLQSGVTSNIELSVNDTSSQESGKSNNISTAITSRLVDAFFYVPNSQVLSMNVPMEGEYVDSIRIHYVNGTVAEKKIYIGNDPLLSKAWHLKNSGKDTVSYTSVIEPNVDYNVIPAWKSGASGKGVTVLVVDDDMQINHEDLRANVDISSTYNLKNGTHDTSLALDSSQQGKGHGTAVAGIIAAEGGNFRGSRGVAYESKLAGLNYVAVNSSFSNVFKSSHVLGNDKVRILNNSWIKNEFGQSISSGEWDILDAIAAKKKIVVAAVGNYFEKSLVNGDRSCINLGLNVSCVFAQGSTISIHPESIIVASAGADGSIADYSNSGGNIWVTGLGGGLSGGYRLWGPQILTTDLSGCEAGYAYSIKNTSVPFDQGASVENENCNYASSFNGTSAATPGISGVIALMLSANPKLDSGQVRYILMRTARNDSSDESGGGILKSQHAETYDYSIYGSNFEYDNGWITNAAGIRSSVRYGFGLPDANAAVEMARHCNNDSYNGMYESECATRSLDNQGKVVYTGRIVDSVPFCIEDTIKTMQFNDTESNKEEVVAYKYTCHFNHEVDSLIQGDSSLNITVTDSAYLEIGSDFEFDNDRADISADCSTADFVMGNFTKAKSMLQFELYSPQNTKSILKPIYQNLGSFKHMLFEKNMPILTLRTNQFYGETISSGYKAVVYSKCPLKLPQGNGDDFMRVVVRGFKQ